MQRMGKMRPLARRESGYSDEKEQSFPACAGKGMKEQLHPSIGGLLRRRAKIAQRSATEFADFPGKPQKRFLDFVQTRSAGAQQGNGRGVVGGVETGALAWTRGREEGREARRGVDGRGGGE